MFGFRRSGSPRAESGEMEGRQAVDRALEMLAVHDASTGEVPDLSGGITGYTKDGASDLVGELVQKATEKAESEFSGKDLEDYMRNLRQLEGNAREAIEKYLK